MRRILAVLTLIAAAAAALVLTAADEPKHLKRYEVVLDSAFGLVDGGDLKIGGVKAGQTTDFELVRKPPYHVIVTAEVTEEGFDSLRTDATCAVRQQSLIGEYFVDCEAGRAEAELPDGGRIPVQRTSSTIPPDLINTVMRRPYRERFRLIISELGTGLAGRPEELNEVVRRAHPALRELSQTFTILREQNTQLRDFIRDADTVSAAVEPVREEVARWARESSETAALQATRAEELGRYWNRLPDFLAELEPTMAELERTAVRQTPALRKLGGAAPELTSFLAAAEPFAKATRLSIDDLGEAAKEGSTAIRTSRQEVRELRRLARHAPRLGKPLRQFLQSLDDRRRSTEFDPAARAPAPPAPDKTAYREGQGFTGMESLANYFVNQTLAINSFDEFGHILRIAVFTLGPCSGYNAKPTKSEIEKCASWLGPYQPGVNAPDPTRNGVAAREAAERRAPAPTRPEREPRLAGEPEAPPVKGQRDLSKPQIVIPEPVRELLKNLRKPLERKPQPQGAAPGDVTGLLDFLLAP